MKASLNITNLTFAKALTVTRNTQSHKFVELQERYATNFVSAIFCG